MWEPIIYQYSTCSSLLFEEENVYVGSSPAVIRSHYRTIPQRTRPDSSSPPSALCRNCFRHCIINAYIFLPPQVYRECSSEESTMHLFLFTDPQYEYQVCLIGDLFRHPLSPATDPRWHSLHSLLRW